MLGRTGDTRLYHPINAYGVIGDCHSVVLIAPDGSVDWGCLPDFDSPAIFCRLLDARRGGYFQIAPTEGTVPGKQCAADEIHQYQWGGGADGFHAGGDIERLVGSGLAWHE